MSNTTNFYLFKITIDPIENSEYTSFEKMLLHPREAQIKLTKKGNQFQLDGKVTKIGGFFTGTFCLIQKKELPTKAKFGEEPTDIINDGDDSGLGHYTSFMYDQLNQVIAIQSNRNGVSANGIVAYFQRNYKVKEIILELIINPDEISKLQKMTTISSFAVTIVKPQSGLPFGISNQNKALNEMTNLADNTNANTLTIQVGIGYEKESSLKKSQILSYITSLFSSNQNLEVKKVEVKGRETDEGTLEILDLITNKVSITITYESPKTITPRFLKEILKKLVNSYSELKPKLDSTYKVKRNQN